MSKPKILEMLTFSTEEQETGEYWTDGKPIYRKTFVKNGSGSIDLSELNFDKIFFDFSNSYLKILSPERIVPLTVITTVDTNTGRRQAGVYIEGSNLTIESGLAFSLGENIVTLRYTKKD